MSTTIPSQLGSWSLELGDYGWSAQHSDWERGDVEAEGYTYAGGPICCGGYKASLADVLAEIVEVESEGRDFEKFLTEIEAHSARFCLHSVAFAEAILSLCGTHYEARDIEHVSNAFDEAAEVL